MSARGRDEAFARALDDGTATDDAAGYGPVVTALHELRVDLAAQTTPTATFQDGLRTRLLAVAAVGPAASAPAAVRRRRWLRPVAAVCAGLVAVVLVLGGVVVGARHALPGDALYGAKRATEAFQVRTTSGSLDQGLRRLHLAQTRLAEVRALAARGGGEALGSARDGAVLAAGADDGLIRSTLAAMDDDTRTGSGQVERAALASRERVPLTVLQAWSAQQAERLHSLAAVLPASTQDRLDASLTLVEDLGETTATLLAPG